MIASWRNRRSSGTAGGDEVRNDRRAAGLLKGQGALFDLAVGDRDALVLAQVFAPRRDDEGLDVVLRLGRVAVQPPARGAISEANDLHALHGLAKGVML